MMALRTAATGMAAQDLNVDVISNNIANMNTVGFKKGRAEFEDLIYQTIEQPGSQSSTQGTIVPTGVQVGAGVKAGSVYTIGTQGSLTQTGNPLDLAIQGPGYFQVLMPDGQTAFTRAGNFSVNAQGQLVTADGFQVIPQIQIPQGATNVTISNAGQVQVTVAGNAAPAAGRAAAAGDLLQRRRLEPAGQQPVHPDRRLGGARRPATRASRGLAPCCRATPRRPTSIR